MTYYKRKRSHKQLSAHSDLLSACSRIFSDALQAGTSPITIDVDEEWILELFQHWLYFGEWKSPCDFMREHPYKGKKPHEHSNTCYPGDPEQLGYPEQHEIMEVICFANKYEVLELLEDAEIQLCERLNDGEGIDGRTIYTAQNNLCRFHPVVQLLAKAYAACGTSEPYEWMFYEGLKPTFMTDILCELSLLREEGAIERKDRYDFELEHCRPVHERGQDNRMDEDNDSATTADAAKTNEEAV